MTDTGHDQDLPKGLGAVAQHARDLSRAPVSERVERLGRERLVVTALTALHARPRVKLELRAFDFVRVRWLAGAGAVLAVALIGLGGWALLRDGLRRPEQLAALSGGGKSRSPSTEAPLTYRSYGGQPSAANYLVAPEAHADASDSHGGHGGHDAHEGPSGLRFSDGSEIVASPGARLRVDSTQSRGARVFLEQGRTRTHVEHRDHGELSNWVFVAGPFDVHVTGTTFNLAWDAGSQTVDLELIEGSVSVTSPLGPSQIEVKTGQRFHASMLEGTMQLESADPAHASGTAASMTTAGSPAVRPLARSEGSSHAGRAQRTRRAAHGRVARARLAESPLSAAEPEALEPTGTDTEGPATDDTAAGSFSDLMRAGAFARVIELATAAGLGKTLERGSADDVRALADAARYLHRTELAVRGLTVLRTRFPGTHHGTSAAFLLGRTYENAARQSEARRFYELYLRETPSGEFAAEALAGRMRMVAALDGEEAAQTIADEYLRRFPRGVHAAAARQLARSIFMGRPALARPARVVWTGGRAAGYRRGVPVGRAHASKAPWRWIGSWLLGCALAGCLVSVVSLVSLVSLAHAQERVLLLAPETPDPLLLELYHRLEAELRIHGFETETLVSTPDESARKDLGAQVSARRALAAIAVLMRNRSAALDVWLVAADGGPASLRSLTANAGDETANLVAVRAVDLLRASLAARSGRASRAETRSGEAARAETRTSEPARAAPVAAPGSPAQPPSTTTSSAPSRALSPREPEPREEPAEEEIEPPAPARPARPQPLLSFRAEAFGLWQGARFGAALGPALGARVCPLSHLCLSAGAAGAFGLARFETALGSAVVRQELFFAELEIPLVWLGDLQLSAAAGGGVMLLQAEGHAIARLTSLDASQWTWTAGAGPRLTLELSARWSLTAALRVRLYLPDVAVAVASESATLARPTLDAALGVAFSP